MRSDADYEVDDDREDSFEKVLEGLGNWNKNGIYHLVLFIGVLSLIKTAGKEGYLQQWS